MNDTNDAQPSESCAVRTAFRIIGGVLGVGMLAFAAWGFIEEGVPKYVWPTTFFGLVFAVYAVTGRTFRSYEEPISKRRTREQAKAIVDECVAELQSMTDAELISLNRGDLSRDVTIEGVDARLEIWDTAPSKPGESGVYFAVRLMTKERVSFGRMLSYSVLWQDGFILEDGVRRPMVDRDFWIY